MLKSYLGLCWLLSYAALSGCLETASYFLRSPFFRGAERVYDTNALAGDDAWDSLDCDAECCSMLADREWRNLEEGEAGGATISLPLHWNLVIVVILVCLSGLFSGLTLGLMGLDKTGLEVVMGGDDVDLARAAKKIYPVRADGNLLLCTLLLGNVAVNSLLSILMADLTSGTIGFVVSTATIVIFGEILPQAICSRHALRVGMYTVPLVRVFIVLLFPIAKPLAFALDKILGRELVTVFSKSELSKLFEIQVREGQMDKDVGTAMTGALKYQDVTVSEVMTTLKDVFMLNADQNCDRETIINIFKAGYSRIPVYEVSRSNIIGLLFVKDLIFIDKDKGECTSVRSLVQIFGRGLHVVWEDDKLGDVLRLLKQGRSHMALVKTVNNNDDTGKDPFYEIVGIITLEDIIEVILGDDIIDETDSFVDSTTNSKVRRTDLDWARLSLLHTEITAQMLSIDEGNAITAHLLTNHGNIFSHLSETQLRKLIATTPITEYQTAEQEFGQDLPNIVLYKTGEESDICTIILSGKITILAGKERFRSDVSNFAVLASKSLTDSNYSPDFTAYVSVGPCRCICISRDRFTMAMDASAQEKLQASFTNRNENSTNMPTADNGNRLKQDWIQSSERSSERSLTLHKEQAASDI